MSDMLREELVFGPIVSRRLGSSLGINVLPAHGKICNFDCIYCECGLNADGRGDVSLPSASQLERTLEGYMARLVAEGTRVDSVTFSGDGEPTLNPEFPRMVEIAVGARDRFLPGAKVSVLTNGTRLGCPEILAALKKVDNPIIKLDAVSDTMARRINAPQCDYHVDAQVDAMKAFGGDFVLQTMLLKGPLFDSQDMMAGWKEIVRTLHPREIQLYTIARPVPVAGLEKYSADRMRSMVQDLLDEGFNIKIYE